MTSLLVLGANGMLGNEMLLRLRESYSEISFTTRTGESVYGSPTFKFDLSHDRISEFLKKFGYVDYIINCIGSISHKMQMNSTAYSDAIKINSIFPHLLARESENVGAKVIQIATDCVFNGENGLYSESSEMNANDLYGISKRCGEVNGPNFMNLRCSIIGHELNSNYSLLSWFLSQPIKANLQGYKNSLWNGLTVTGFYEYINSIISQNLFQAGTFHAIPSDSVSKYDLLCLFRENFFRADLDIFPNELIEKKDRRLTTNFAEQNHRIWQGTAYSSVPTISRLIEDERFLTIEKGRKAINE